MEIPVLIEPVAGNGFRASAGAPFSFAADGATREEAFRKVEELIRAKLHSGAQLVRLEIKPEAKPWMAWAGAWDPEDPIVQEWQRLVQERRRAEDGAQEGPRTGPPA